MSQMRIVTLSLLAAFGLSAAARAQTPANPATPPVDAGLPEQLKELRELVADKKLADDQKAIGQIELLTRNIEQRHPKDQERLAKALGEVFRTGKLRTGEHDVLYRQAGDALAKLGKLGGKELRKALDDDRFDKQFGLLAHWILALGRTADHDQVDWLLDTTTRSPHDELRAAAGEALGGFTSLPLDGKRRIVKAIVREWGSQHQQATTPDPVDPNQPIPMQPQNARRTLQRVEGPWNATLQQLTGVSLSAFADWQRWLNKNPDWVPPAATAKPAK
jgi:hypothetical protein